MELTIDLIIGTSGVLAILCWILSVHHYRHATKLSGTTWLVIGILCACLAGFFSWSAIPLWIS